MLCGGLSVNMWGLRLAYGPLMMMLMPRKQTDNDCKSNIMGKEQIPDSERGISRMISSLISP